MKHTQKKLLWYDGDKADIWVPGGMDEKLSERVVV
jgi:hypothetical protein